MLRLIKSSSLAFLTVITLCAVNPVEAWASKSSIPVPERKTDLKAIEQGINKENKKKEELEKHLKDIEKELAVTKKNLIGITKSVQKQEALLQKIEKESVTLETEKSVIETRLKREYGSIGNLVLALERIRRMPPQALFIKPGAPLKTAQTALILENVLPEINERAEKLGNDLERFGKIEEQLETDRKNIATALAKLDDKRVSMTSLMNKRKELQKKTRKDYDIHAANAQRMAQEAQSLKDLMREIERAEQQREREKNERLAGAIPTKSRILTLPPVSMPKRGVIQLPVNGNIIVKYGEKDHIGAKSQGLSIEGRAGSVVVAPMGGIVRFAGFFKNHGNLVIIEHEKGYHSLVAGLARIDTVVGQTVDSGEPIGSMETPLSGLPVVYYELRYKGNPVHPSKKFSGLG